MKKVVTIVLVVVLLILIFIGFVPVIDPCRSVQYDCHGSRKPILIWLVDGRSER